MIVISSAKQFPTCLDAEALVLFQSEHSITQTILLNMSRARDTLISSKSSSYFSLKVTLVPPKQPL
jgi:triphosphoribosyl-dephospho-CoA synthetase